MAFTVDHALLWWYREFPDKPAIVFDDEACSWAKVRDWSGRVGAWLIEQGVRPGDRIGMIAANSLEYAILTIATMRIGAVGAPLTFRSAVEEVRDGFGGLEPRLIFADDDRQALVAEAMTGGAGAPLLKFSQVRDFEKGAAVTLDHACDEDAPLFIIGTSGSTARPKGVIYTNRMVMTYTAEFVMMEPVCGKGSSILSLGPFSSASGYLLLLQFLSAGATVYMESRFDPAHALRQLVDKKITAYLGAPIFFEKLAALPEFAEADLSHLHFTQVGGARVSGALQEAWARKGVTLRQAYGCTEAGGAWAARDETAIDQPEKAGRGGMFSHYAIAGDHGGFAAPGVPGEILISSPIVTTGYWNNPQASAEALRDGWLHTGDIGVIDETGNVTFVNRLKDIIITGGLNVSAAEVERVIGDIPGITEVAVIAAPDPEFGETPVAVIYAEGDVSVQIVLDQCDRHLSRYKVPRYIVFEKEPLPRLTSGKIAKRIICEQYEDAVSRLARVR